MPSLAAEYVLWDLSQGVSVCASGSSLLSMDWPVRTYSFVVLRSVLALEWRPLPREIVGEICSRSRMGHVDLAEATRIELRTPADRRAFMECDALEGAHDVWLVAYRSFSANPGLFVPDTFEVVVSRGGSPPELSEPHAAPREPSPLPLMASMSHLGFVLCDEEALASYARRVGADDLLARFVDTEEGDELLQDGVVVPFMGMTPWTYRIVLARSGDSLSWPAGLVGSNAGIARRYRLRTVSGAPTIFEGQALRYWSARDRYRLGSLPLEGDRLVSVERFDHFGQLDDHPMSTHVLRDEGAYRGEAIDEPWIDLGPLD